MQLNIKYIVSVIAVIIAIIIVFYIFNKPQCNMIRPSNIKSSTANNTEIIDRLPLVREPTNILPANEIYQINYKNVNMVETNVEKELYTDDKPLYDMNSDKSLTPPDLNSTQRRVNFIEIA